MNTKELREELKNLGLSDEVLSGIEDDKLQGVLDKLKPKELGFDDFLKADIKHQSEFDRRITKAIETAKKKDTTPPETPPSNEDESKQPEWVKSLFTKLDNQAQEIEGLKERTVRRSKLDQAKTLLGKTDLPDSYKEKWLSRINVNSDASIEDQVSSLTEEYKDLRQTIQDSKDFGGTPPKPGFAKEPSKEELDKYISV